MSRRRAASSPAGGDRYDLLQLPLLDSLATARRARSVEESYVYTVEAFAAVILSICARAVIWS